MKLEYINQIKININNFSNKRTSNLLDGTYRSVYKGKSLNFDGLRAYEINDDVKDIDWKSSSRSGQVLVKQYVSDKKHNILFILDTGEKMEAYANVRDIKKELALYTAGTLGYLAVKNGDFIGFLFNEDKKTNFLPFKCNIDNLEEYLVTYEKHMTIKDKFNINDSLNYIVKNLKKRMIIFIITDLGGIDKMDNNLLRQLSFYNDIMLINIEDMNMVGDELYDIDSSNYIPSIFLNDKTLNELEENIKNNMFIDNKHKFNKNRIDMVSIGKMEDINIRIIELLERHRYGNNR